MAVAAKKKAPKTGPRKRTARQKAKTQKAIARKISDARTQSGLTRKEVAKSVGLSPSLVGKIERGERGLDPLELARFARLFKKSIVDFIR